MKKIGLFLLLCGVSLTGHAYQSEDRLQGMLIGKMAQFISWQDQNTEDFTIAVLDESFAALLQTLYSNTKIKNKPVKVKHISSIDQISNTDVLYISNVSPAELENIIELAKANNILTISNMRGFAERNGMVQIYFVSQKPRLRINLDSTRQANFQIQSTLLQISDVIQAR
jgi:peroxiredoxin